MLVTHPEVMAGQMNETGSTRSHFGADRTCDLLVQAGCAAQIIGLVGMCVLLFFS